MAWHFNFDSFHILAIYFPKFRFNSILLYIVLCLQSSSFRKCFTKIRYMLLTSPVRFMCPTVHNIWFSQLLCHSIYFWLNQLH